MSTIFIHLNQEKLDEQCRCLLTDAGEVAKKLVEKHNSPGDYTGVYYMLTAPIIQARWILDQIRAYGFDCLEPSWQQSAKLAVCVDYDELAVVFEELEPGSDEESIVEVALALKNLIVHSTVGFSSPQEYDA